MPQNSARPAMPTFLTGSARRACLSGTLHLCPRQELIDQKFRMTPSTISTRQDTGPGKRLAIETLSIGTVQMTHKTRQVTIRSLSQKAIGVVPQAVEADANIPELCDILEQGDKDRPVFITFEDVLSSAGVLRRCHLFLDLVLPL